MKAKKTKLPAGDVLQRFCTRCNSPRNFIYKVIGKEQDKEEFMVICSDCGLITLKLT